MPALGGTGRPLGIREPGHAAADNPALSSLREELGDAAVARFVGRYLSLLDQRITRIGRSIAEQRLQPGVTVLLTLETTSQMVGALQLSACATALRTALQRQGADVTALYDALVAAGAATRSQLART